MLNRKRRTARPMLESMEDRVVPSTVGLEAHHGRLVASHVHQINKPVKQAENSQRTNDTALSHLQQQLAVIQARSLEHSPSARETPAEKASAATSSLFKSIFASL